jgi:hypothetical protein
MMERTNKIKMVMMKNTDNNKKIPKTNRAKEIKTIMGMEDTKRVILMLILTGSKTIVIIIIQDLLLKMKIICGTM